MDALLKILEGKRMRKFILFLECIVICPVLFFGFSNEVLNFYIEELKQESKIIYGE